MIGQEKVIISFQSEDGQVDGVSEDDITDSTVTECLHIVDYPVNLSALKFVVDVLYALIYGVWVSVVGILLG